MQEKILIAAYTDNTEEIKKELFIFLDGAMCGGFAATIVLCIISIGRLKNIKSKSKK